MRRVLWLLTFSMCITLSSMSLAQDEEELLEEDEADEPAAESGDEEAPAEGETEAQEGEGEDAAPAAGPRTWWIGPYVEGIIVPSFLLNLFLAESPTVANPGFGVTVTRRNEEGFSWVLGIGYAGYGFDGPFRAKSDPEQDTEYLNSDLGVLHARGQLLWSVPISSQFSFEYGVGIELGVVLGSLVRSEAYKKLDGEWDRCVGPLIPDATGTFCEPTTNGLPTNGYDEEGAHYGVTEERVPPVAAALMLPALALRFTPIEQLAIKLEASFGLMQFTFGLSAAYGLGA